MEKDTRSRGMGSDPGEPLDLLVIGMDPPVHFNFMIDPGVIAPGLRPVALAASHDDPDEIEKLKGLAKVGGLKFSTRWQELIEEVKAVAYLGPYGYRGKVFPQLFSVKGLEVLVIDKPLACTPEELREVEAAWKRRPDLDIHPLLTVRYDLRYDLIKAIYEAGLTGEVIKAEAWRPHKLGKRPRWFFKRETYPGVIEDLCVHDVDIICYITGQRFVEVYGAYEIVRRDERGEITLYGGFGATLENGGAVSITADWLTGPEAPYHGDTGLSLTCSRGRLEFISDGAAKGLYIESGLAGAEGTLREILARFCQAHALGEAEWGLEVMDRPNGYFKISCPKTDYRLDFQRALSDFFLFRQGKIERPVVTMADLVAASRVTVTAAEMARKSGPLERRRSS